jgi:hypothetical protein
MSIVGWIVLKMVVLAVIAGAAGFYAGITGRSLEEVLHGSRSQEDQS